MSTTQRTASCLNRLGALAMATWLAVAVIGLIAIVFVWVMYRVELFVHGDPDRSFRWEEAIVTLTGSPAVHVQGATHDRHYLDAQRQPLTDGIFPGQAASLASSHPRLSRGKYQFHSRLAEIGFGSSANGDRQNWFQMNDDRGTWFEGFGPLIGQRLGYLGRNGWSKTPLAADDLFPMTVTRGRANVIYGPADNSDQWNATSRTPDRSIGYRDAGDALLKSSHVLLAHDRTLWWVDLASRKLVTIEYVEAIRSIAQLEVVEPASPEELAKGWLGRLSPRLAVRTDRHIDILDFSPALNSFDPAAITKVSFEIPEGLREQYFTAYQIQPTKVALVTSTPVADLSPKLVHFGERKVTVVDQASGQVASTGTVRLENRGYSGWGLRATTNLEVICAPAPVFTGAMILLGRAPSSSFLPTYGLRLLWSMQFFWPAFLAACIVGVCCTVLLAWHRAQRRLPRSFGWMLFAFLFGLPGLIGYLLHRPWPSKRVLPAPQLTGTEVFA